MTKQQVVDLIEKNKLHMIRVYDMAGNLLAEMSATSPQGAVNDLEELLPNFLEYRKLKVCAKKGTEDTPWSKGMTWQLDLGIGNALPGAAAAIGNNGIGAMDFIGMYKDMMNENFKLQRELMETTLKSKSEDPEKWLPIMKFAAETLNLGGQAGGIQGPPQPGAAAQTKELHFADVDAEKKLTAKEVGEKVWEQLNKLQKRVTGPQMIKLLTRLEQNENLSAQCEDVCFLLEAIIKDPSLLTTAVKFIKS